MPKTSTRHQPKVQNAFGFTPNTSFFGKKFNIVSSIFANLVQESAINSANYESSMGPLEFLPENGNFELNPLQRIVRTFGAHVLLIFTACLPACICCSIL
jgi:hypothetical protein